MPMLPLEFGASDDDRDDMLGASEDDRDDVVRCVLVVPAVPERIKGGRSRIEGGEIDLPVCRYGDGRRLWQEAGKERLLALLLGYRPSAMLSSMKD